MTEQNAAVLVAKEKREYLSDEFVVQGVNVRLVSVPLGLIQDAQSHLREPKVPIWHNETKNRDEENPNDPDYLDAVEKYKTDLNTAAIDTFVMFGIEIDKLPDDDAWLKKLQWSHKRGTIDLSGIDFEDELDLEFLFKKYVIGTKEVISVITSKTAIGPEVVKRAKDGF